MDRKYGWDFWKFGGKHNFSESRVVSGLKPDFSCELYWYNILRKVVIMRVALSTYSEVRANLSHLLHEIEYYVKRGIAG